jgi:ribose 5-phosphate isomerase B
MKIAMGADHAGFELKDRIREYLQEKGLQVLDEGTQSADSVDYPDFARLVAHDVRQHRADFGILVCGSGIGMAMAANKVDGIRAVNASSEKEAELSREHNNANVLTLGARLLQDEQAFAIVEKWLATPFAGGRHEKRVEKIAALEQGEKQIEVPDKKNKKPGAAKSAGQTGKTAARSFSAKRS